MADETFELTTAYPYADTQEVIGRFDVVAVATFTEDAEDTPVRLIIRAQDADSNAEAYLTQMEATRIAHLLLDAALRCGFDS